MSFTSHRQHEDAYFLSVDDFKGDSYYGWFGRLFSQKQIDSVLPKLISRDSHLWHVSEDGNYGIWNRHFPRRADCWLYIIRYHSICSFSVLSSNFFLKTEQAHAPYPQQINCGKDWGATPYAQRTAIPFGHLFLPDESGLSFVQFLMYVRHIFDRILPTPSLGRRQRVVIMTDRATFLNRFGWNFLEEGTKRATLWEDESITVDFEAYAKPNVKDLPSLGRLLLGGVDSEAHAARVLHNARLSPERSFADLMLEPRESDQGSLMPETEKIDELLELQVLRKNWPRLPPYFRWHCNEILRGRAFGHCAKVEEHGERTGADTVS